MELKVRERLNSQLPATPCTTKMRETIEKMAVDMGVSKAEIQRLAFSFFLSSFATETITDDSIGSAERLAS